MAKRGFWLRVRRSLLIGVIVIAPVGVTVLVLAWIFQRLDRILGRYVEPVLGMPIPGLGFLALLIVVALVGWIARRAVGRQVLGFWNSLIGRLPFAGTLYNAASQIVQALLAKDKQIFKSCVLIEYPRPGCWTVGFLTQRGAQEICDVVGEECVAVFLPTAPNPTSGYLLFLPTEQVRPLRMSVEDGFKLIISGGAVVPQEKTRLIRGLDLEALLREEG